VHVDAEGRHFDLILVEALDRLARKLAGGRIFTTG
jgi:hypothetical protein